MQNRLVQQLEKAQALCHEGDFYQAYTLFKRFYDRIPFQLEEGHVSYINQFGRCLGELGRTSEMRFYWNEIERNSHRYPIDAVKFIQGVLLCMMVPPEFKKARPFFEDVLRGDPSPDVKARTKVWLALTYERIEEDYRTCRKIINSISDVDDIFVNLTVEVWKNHLLVNEKEFKEAEKGLLALQQKFESDVRDWYLSFSTQVILCNLYIKAGRRKDAIERYTHLEKMLGDGTYTFSRRSLTWLEGLLRNKKEDELTSITVDGEGAKFTFEDLQRSVKLCTDSNIHRLLTLFSERKVVTKDCIVERLYGREYSERQDDKLVYYHIHALRKFLVENGLSDRAIIKDRGGYAIAPKVLAGVENET